MDTYPIQPRSHGTLVIEWSDRITSDCPACGFIVLHFIILASEDLLFNKLKTGKQVCHHLLNAGFNR
jgi:hypothetical protein